MSDPDKIADAVYELMRVVERLTQELEIMNRKLQYIAEEKLEVIADSAEGIAFSLNQINKSLDRSE